MRHRSLAVVVLFLLPAVLIYSVFKFIPVLYSIYYALTDWQGVTKPVFVGLSNIREILSDRHYWLTVGNSFRLIAATVLVQIPGAAVVAYLIFRTFRGMRFFRAVYFFPVVIAPIAIGLMFGLFYNTSGPFNQLLRLIGLEEFQQNWLSNKDLVVYSVIFPVIWSRAGLFIVILLAAYISIPQELFESASLEGASAFRTFLEIVLPLVWEVVIICIVLGVNRALQEFPIAWAITGGGPGYASAFVSIYMYKSAFYMSKFGYGSAITVTMMLFALAFSITFRRIARRDVIEY